MAITDAARPLLEKSGVAGRDLVGERRDHGGGQLDPEILAEGPMRSATWL
jgi:hypothetical protein